MMFVAPTPVIGLCRTFHGSTEYRTMFSTEWFFGLLNLVTAGPRRTDYWTLISLSKSGDWSSHVKKIDCSPAMYDRSQDYQWIVDGMLIRPDTRRADFIQVEWVGSKKNRKKGDHQAELEPMAPK